MKFQLILKITLVIISLCSIHSQIESIAPGSKVKIKGKHEELRALHKEASMLRRDGKHDEAKEKVIIYSKNLIYLYLFLNIYKFSYLYIINLDGRNP